MRKVELCTGQLSMYNFKTDGSAFGPEPDVQRLHRTRAPEEGAHSHLVGF